ncbi:MLO-like protein 13 isoform X2 [Musa acuminata AAA Group]|uniref:MLO-like protein 13 isoform X2 n=1 Tax=Musa acuminata AAA Group TaxID=214697 RepID=UPI0031D0CD4D
MAGPQSHESLEYTPTWVVAAVCTIFVVISLLVERFLHYLGKFLKHNQQDALYKALQKLKEELMLLGFISLLLTVFQRTISRICVSKRFFHHMLPCKENSFPPNQEVHRAKGLKLQLTWNNRKLLSEDEGSDICMRQGKVPLLSLEALHQLHIFIFVLAVVHVVFCATTMVLGGAKIRKWKLWENDIRKGQPKKETLSAEELSTHVQQHNEFVMEHTEGLQQRSVVLSWIMSFLKQFYASVTKSDYIALRSGFIMKHCSSNPDFDFHKYMLRTLEDDFKIVVGIRWYLWLFVVLFLLLNVNGWHTFFWLSFLPLVLLLAVGTKLEHIITCLAQEAAEKPTDGQVPKSTYGFYSCIMEKVGYIVPRLLVGVIIQVLCSYSTLPLYTIVTQMGDMFKQAIFDEQLRSTLHGWAETIRKRKEPKTFGVSSFMKVINSKSKTSVSGSRIQMQNTTLEADGSSGVAERPVALE